MALQNLEDRSAVAVHADELEERGDPRAELVRAELTHDKERARELIKAHWSEWVGSIAPREVLLRWQSGYVVEAALTRRQNALALTELLERSPHLRRLSLELFRELSPSPLSDLRSLRELFHFYFIDAEGDLREVQQNILREFSYQSSLELGHEVYDLIRHIPEAGELARNANEKGVSLEELPITPADVARVSALVAGGDLNDKLARQVIEGVLAGEGTPDEVVEKRGLKVVSDEGALGTAVDEAIAGNAAIADKIRGGKVAAVGALVGAVMKATRGQADAARVKELILERLGVTEG